MVSVKGMMEMLWKILDSVIQNILATDISQGLE